MDVLAPQSGLPDPSSYDTQAFAQLTCLACRTHKLKCDRLKPCCSRCSKADDHGKSCVYPKSRRKPAVQYRHVKVLEARLAHVEALLHAAEQDRPSPSASTSRPADLDPLPPDVIDELHRHYFELQPAYLPILHPGRYLAAYQSARGTRPPAALQYALWTLSAQSHERLSSHQESLYRRARQQLEADETQGSDADFVTVAHAQAWLLLALYEARRLSFSRAAMSCSRCVRLVSMLGLHQLDPADSVTSDWTALEERRRVFWGAFCIDSQASITTGWPGQLRTDHITTRLPSSEASFEQGREKEPSRSCRLDDVLAGHPYTAFASTVVVFHLFRAILAHVQDEDDHRNFWRRHGDLDTKLSSVFVFLPAPFRLPQNMGDPVAVRTNLGLHAAVVCLHQAAHRRADTHSRPASARKTSRDRLAAAAQEIVGILQATTCTSPAYVLPLSSLAMYCAASVLACQAATETAGASDAASHLQCVLQHLASVGHGNNFAQAFLQQAVVDMESSGLVSLPAFSWLAEQAEQAKQAKQAKKAPVTNRSISALCRLADWGPLADILARDEAVSTQLPSPEVQAVSSVEELSEVDPAADRSIEEERIDARIAQTSARLESQWPYF